MELKDFTNVYEAERTMEYSKWTKEIPLISFPSDWQIKITPPFAAAIVRFQVKKGDAFISVYLDCYDNLGCYGEPYWEIYPYKEDTFRCDMADVEGLLKAITESIEQQDTK